MTDIKWGDFEWDSNKSEANWEKHGISFEQATAIFEEPYLKIASDRSGETRWLALGKAKDRVIAVIYTERRGRIRIISARAARTSERESYHRIIGDAP
jgi:uncharacterized DUF497 family protein